MSCFLASSIALRYTDKADKQQQQHVFICPVSYNSMSSLSSTPSIPLGNRRRPFWCAMKSGKLGVYVRHISTRSL
jgi:hypothetical protein